MSSVRGVNLVTRMHWLDVVLAPLTLLERARGRRRVALMMLYAVVFGSVGVLVGREAVLWQLPDAPEPFDLVKSGHVDLADADNAMVLYREAGTLLVADRALFTNLPMKAGSVWTWETTDPSVRAWAERNRPALAAWLRGTARPDALLVQPEQSRSDTDFGPIAELRTLALLGTLEATRLRAAGDLAGAWSYHLGVIRTCLHGTRHEGIAAALIMARVGQMTNPTLWAWLDDPRLTPDLIRRASADLARCRAILTTPSDVLRTEFFAARAMLANPDDWIKWEIDRNNPTETVTHLPGFLWGRNFLANEPKRSLKVFRLIMAGQLARCEQPAASRPPVVSPEYLIYAIDAATPPPLQRISPAKLIAWADASGCRGVVPQFNFGAAFVPSMENYLAGVRLRVAERAYALDHAGQSPQTYGDLSPAYLDALPFGVEAADSLVAH